MTKRICNAVIRRLKGQSGAGKHREWLIPHGLRAGCAETYGYITRREDV